MVYRSLPGGGLGGVRGSEEREGGLEVEYILFGREKLCFGPAKAASLLEKFTGSV